MATGKKPAKIAAQQLTNPKTPKKQLKVDGSALAQAPHKAKKKGKG